MFKIKLTAIAAVATLLLSGAVVTTSVQPAGAHAITRVKVCDFQGCRIIYAKHNHGRTRKK